jgi:hypothetical protein
MNKKTDLINQIKQILKGAWNYVKTHTVLVGFYLLAFIFLINSVFMTLHYINRNYDYRILNNLYIEAVLPDQDITGRLSTGIVKIKELNIDKLDLDDRVVICCDFGIDERWVEDVVSIDVDNDNVEVTYDGVVSVDVNSDEIFGVYLNNANFFGTIYYTSTFLRGYILLIVSQAIVLYLYQRLFVTKVLDGVIKPKKQKSL